MANIKSTGALFKNDRKTSDSHPDYRGDFKMTKELLDEICAAFDRGHDKVQLAGWRKEGRDGRPAFLSISVQPPYVKDQAQQPQSERPAARNTSGQGLDDDIPF